MYMLCTNTKNCYAVQFGLLQYIVVLYNVVKYSTLLKPFYTVLESTKLFSTELLSIIYYMIVCIQELILIKQSNINLVKYLTVIAVNSVH